MTLDSVSRRSVLKSLTIGAAAGSVLSVIPMQAAEHIHNSIEEEKMETSGVYTPKYFDAHEFKTLQMLCETIVPADADSGGAIEAGAPDFIDLLTSENKTYQATLGGGMKWLEAECTKRYGKVYLDSTPAEQKEILDLIAFRKNAEADPSLMQGVQFFSLLRDLTSDGFFTSKIGIKYLGYKGNTYRLDFPGCPPVPGV